MLVVICFIKHTQNIELKENVMMELKVKKESETGLNTEFVNKASGRTISLEQAIKQIDKGNPNYSNYQKVTNPNGTVYIRSKADGNRKNNIE